MNLQIVAEGDAYGRRKIILCVMGGMLGESGDRQVTYEGGSRRCMVVKEVVREEEVHRLVMETTGRDLSEQKLWYSLKYSRQMLM